MSGYRLALHQTQENHRQQIKASLLAEHMKKVDLENDTFAERVQIEGKVGVLSYVLCSKSVK